VLFDKLDTAKIHELDTSYVSSRVVSRLDEPSGIWAYPVTTTNTNENINKNNADYTAQIYFYDCQNL